MATEGLFTNEEMRALILALAHGQDGFTLADAEMVQDWACDARISAATLGLVLKGRMHVQVKNGEVYFARVDETEKGEENKMQGEYVLTKEQMKESQAPEGVDTLARKAQLLEKYSDRTPRKFAQYDGFTNVMEDCVMSPDNDGDDLHAGFVHELMHGIAPVRVLIHPDADIDVVLRLLGKIRDWIARDGIYQDPPDLKTLMLERRQ